MEDQAAEYLEAKAEENRLEALKMVKALQDALSQIEGVLGDHRPVRAATLYGLDLPWTILKARAMAHAFFDEDAARVHSTESRTIVSEAELKVLAAAVKALVRA